MNCKHGVSDTDTRFIINPITRAIKNEGSKKLILMQGDHNSEKFTFELPRYIEGHDMSKCNQVEVHFLNIGKTDRKSGLYAISDFQISPDDESIVVCSWLISKNATQLSGQLTFLLNFKCIEEGFEKYSWHTDIYKGIYISEGIDAASSFETDYVDIIEQWKESVISKFTADISLWQANTKNALEADITGWKDETAKDIKDWKKEQTDEIHSVMGDFEEYTNNRVNALISRMDSFTSLKDGSTTGDAELIDARIGENGTVYNSVGTAIRTQAQNLQNNLKNMFSKAKMCLFPVWQRGGINGESGNETTAEGRLRTGYLSLATDKLTINVNSGYMVYYFGYEYADGNYTLSTHGSCTENKTITLDLSLYYRFVARALNDEDYMEESELANIELIITPEVLYATKTALELANNKILDIAENGRWSLHSQWIVAGINGGNGTFNDATNRIRTTEYYRPISNVINYEVADGYRMLLFEFSLDKTTGDYTFIKSSGYYTGNGSVEVSKDLYYLFVLRAIEDVEFSGDEYTNITIYSTIDLYEFKNTEFDIPDYWVDAIESKEQEIKNIIIEAAKAENDVAMFFTSADPHYPANTYISTVLRKYLADKCGISLFLCLGDLITDSIVSHEEGLQRVQDAMLYLIKGTDRMIFTQGNHDNNAGIVDGNGQILSERIIYDNEWVHHTSTKLLPLNKVVFDDKRKAYYYDDDLQKIRFISIDSFENKSYTINNGIVEAYNLGKPSDRQIEWIKNVALATVPDGYSVVSFSHLALFTPYVYNGTEYVSLKAGGIGNSDALVKVFKEFISNGGTFIGHFAGHLHHDFLSTKDGITCIQSLNDGTHWRSASYFGEGFEFVGDAPIKTIGTTTECAFDVVIINKSTRQVNLIRVGAGENRSFKY